MTEPDFLRATRASYDSVAADYSGRYDNELDAKPLDRAMLAAFAELVRTAGGGPVADIGCGTGRVTAILDGMGLSAFGIDLSPQMVAVARRLRPALRFDVGSMLGLELPDDALGGILAWYSTIHIPEEQVLEVFAEFYRVLAPGGYLLVAFQASDEPLHLSQALGHAVSLDFQPRQPDAVARLLGAAGFVMRAQMLREPDEEGEFTERTQQAFLLARKPSLAPDVT